MQVIILRKSCRRQYQSGKIEVGHNSGCILDQPISLVERPTCVQMSLDVALC
jgi:hypothetical protein